MSSSNRTESSHPDQLGIYRIESLLGRGGMGEVYLAWDQVLERHVAIKRVRDDRIGDATQRARFLREARMVARLDHPAIIRVYHVLERDDSNYLVMEYVRGQNLGKLIADAALDTAGALALGRDVADGLAEAHAQGLVHRDLKPANVMVTQNSGGAKILDFGLAKPLQQGALPIEEPQLTQTGTLVGTVHAMSPEQAAGQPVDHRSDLFALGGLLYWMLAGRPPFRGDNLLDTLRRIQSEQPEPLARLCPELPERAGRLVERLLEKDRQRRPHSTRWVAQELAALSSGAAAGRLPAAAPLAHGPVSGDAPPRATPRPADVAVLPDDPTLIGPTPDPSPGPEVSDTAQSVIRVLVLTDLVGSTRLVESLGDVRMAELSARHDRMARDLLARYGGLEIDKTDGFLLLFESPGDALAYTLSYHWTLHRLGQGEEVPLAARAGIHLGEVLLRRNPAADMARGAKPLEVEGLAKPTAARVMSLAVARQTLLTRGVFDLARRAAVVGKLADPELRWLDHGPYSFKGIDEALEVCEVGASGFAPLTEPADTEKAKRVVSFSGERMLGWRPAAGQTIPRRPRWELARRLGEGGFGEVWLARHKSGDERVFKFCFEAERLRALQREVTLFRLLRETLGHRHDIASVLDWDFDEAPYFLESEYTDGGDLARWAERRGGLAAVPVARRLELIAGVAEALAAAHSVGVLHKDVKPQNVLVVHDADGRPRPRLADFGIGALTEKARLDQPGFTVQGFTETSLASGSSATGGTVHYMAPELLAGKSATVQADVYALGVLLYQIVVGDFERPLAPGWRREIDDELLTGDIAVCVDGDPERRLRSTAELAERLRTLEQRRRRRQAERRAERRRRRQRWLAAAAAVVLLVTAIIAFQATLARRQAERLQGQAERLRGEAEELVSFLLGDLRGKLQPIGRLDVLESAGEKALEYFDSLQPEDLTDRTVERHAQALQQIGDVRMAQGDLDGALTFFRRSLRQGEELLARDPQNVDWLFRVGQSHFWVGNTLWRQGELDGALEQMRAYLRLSLQVTEMEPGRDDYLLEVGFGHNNVGDVLARRGRPEQATEQFEKALAVSQELVARDPRKASSRLRLATSHLKIGDMLRRDGKLQEGLARYRESVRILEHLLEEDPENPPLRRRLALGHGHVAQLLIALGDLRAALSHNHREVELAQGLRVQDPSNLEWRTNLAAARRNLGATLAKLGDASGALANIRGALELLEEPLRGGSDDFSVRIELAQALHLLGELGLAQGDLASAQAAAERSRGLFEPILEDNMISHRMLSAAFLLTGRVLDAEGRKADADAAWKRAAELIRPFTEGSRDYFNLRLLAMSLLLLGEDESARPVVFTLLAMPYREPRFLKLCGSRGWDLALESPPAASR